MPDDGASSLRRPYDRTYEDGVHYPECDDMGESLLQTFVARTLQNLLEDYFATLGRPVLLGGNQFFYYRRGDPQACVAPDLYVIDGETHDPHDVPCWKTWHHDGKAPALALEVVSTAYKKDYSERQIQRYQDLGVDELIRYDPEYALHDHRRLITHYVRDDDGRLAQRVTPFDRVRSARFDFWLICQPDRSLRIGLGPHGDALWPTVRERVALANARAELDAERSQQDAEHIQKVEEQREAANARAAAAEAEIERLRAELARLRGE